MKKLIYIILIVILLVLVGKYVKEKNQLENEANNTITVIEEDLNYELVDPETGDIIGSSDGMIVETTIYDENADGMIIEEIYSNEEAELDEEIIEENPDFTQDDDETIIAE